MALLPSGGIHQSQGPWISRTALIVTASPESSVYGHSYLYIALLAASKPVRT